MELTADQIRTVLTWAAATDFEAKLDSDDVELVKALCDEIGEDPETWAGVAISLAADPTWPYS